VLKESRDKLKYDGITGQDFSDLISGYRGGYTPKERKEIENKMISGELRGLISTNALELGIDIGKVDTTILTGYPGTRASLWQQSGRAGRSGQSCDTYLVLDNRPFDQYIALDPDWLFETSSENAVIDKNNLFIQLAHIRAASAELPLTLDDIAVFPDLGEIIPVLVRAKELKNENGKFIWNGKAFPAGDYSLRNMDKERYKLTNSVNDVVITEMDEMQAFREIHDDAIYMHDGQSYQVLSLDLQSKTAVAKPTDENYYTDSDYTTDVRVISEQNDKCINRITCYFGDVNVNRIVVGFKKLQFHNHQNLGYQEIDPKLSKAFETEGIWIDLPQNVVDVYNHLIPFKGQERDFWKSYFGGLGFALQNSVMMTTMTTREDIGAADLVNTKNDIPIQSICIYDMFVGGLGYSEKAFDVIERIINNAIKMVSGCKCKDGCPACVGDYMLDKSIVLWGFQNFFEELEPPIDMKTPPIPIETVIKKPFVLDILLDNWNELTMFIKSKGEYLSNFVAMISKVRIENEKIVLLLSNDFYKSWLMEGDNKRMLINMLTQHIHVPAKFDVDVEIIKSDSNDKESKVVKRYNDLVSR
jgi:DEAD/DEAH box helicase domain-containing protein